MMGLVDRLDDKTVLREVDLVDRAGMLPEAPITGKRERQGVQQDHAVDAVVSDQYRRLPGMTAYYVAERGYRPGEHGLQRFPARDRRPVRSPISAVEHLRPSAADLVRRKPLPLPVIDVDQT